MMPTTGARKPRRTTWGSCAVRRRNFDSKLGRGGKRHDAFSGRFLLIYHDPLHIVYEKPSFLRCRTLTKLILFKLDGTACHATLEEANDGVGSIAWIPCSCDGSGRGNRRFVRPENLCSHRSPLFGVSRPWFLPCHVVKCVARAIMASVTGQWPSSRRSASSRSTCTNGRSIGCRGARFVCSEGSTRRGA